MTKALTLVLQILASPKVAKLCALAIGSFIALPPLWAQSGGAPKSCRSVHLVNTLNQIASEIESQRLGQGLTPGQVLVVDPTNFQQAGHKQLLYLGLHHVAQTFHKAKTFPNPETIGPFVFQNFDAHLESSVHVLSLGPPKRYTPEEFQFLPSESRPSGPFVAPQITAFFRLAFRNTIRNGQEYTTPLPLETLLNKRIFSEAKFNEFKQVVELGRGAIDGSIDTNSLQHYTNTFTKLFNVISPLHLENTLVAGITLEPRLRDYFVREWGFTVDRAENISDGRPGYIITVRAKDLHDRLIAKQKDPTLLENLVERERENIHALRRHFSDAQNLKQQLKNKVLFRVFTPERISETHTLAGREAHFSRSHPNPRPDSDFPMVEIIMTESGQKLAQFNGRHYPLDTFSARIIDVQDPTYSSAVALSFKFRQDEGSVFNFEGQIPLFTGQIQFQKSVTGMLDKEAATAAYNLTPQNNPEPQATYQRRFGHYFTSTEGHSHGSLNLQNLYTVVGNIQLQKSDIGHDFSPPRFSTFEQSTQNYRYLYRDTMATWTVQVREMPLYDNSGNTKDWRNSLPFFQKSLSGIIAEIPAETLFLKGAPEPADFFTMSDPTQAQQVMTMNSHASVQIFPFWSRINHSVPVRAFVEAINSPSAF